MADVKVPSKLGSMSPTFQKAWYKRNNMPLPPHLTGSVKQASKEVKPSERAKALQTKSIQAYGATKGTKVGGEHGSAPMGDTVKPLTKDQWSKIDAAKRAAKAAEKAKRPVIKSKEDRLSFLKGAFAKAKSPERAKRFDVPTLDKEHENLRRDNDLMHSVGVRHSYNEGYDPSPAEIAKMLVDKHGKNVTKDHIKELEDERDTHGGLDHEEIMKHVKKMTEEVKLDEGNKENKAKKNEYVANIIKKKLNPVVLPSLKFGRRELKKEEVQVDETVATAQKVMDRANVVAKTERDPKKRMAAGGLARKAMLRTINPTGVNTGIVRGGGNKTYRMLTGKVPPYQLTPKTGVSEEVEFNEAVLPGTESPLENKMMVVASTRVTSAGTKMPTSLGQKLAKRALKNAEHPIAQHMGEEKDAQEYGYEGDMAMSQLKSIISNAQRLHDMLEPDTDLPEWVQSKITLAEDYIVTAANYCESDLDEEVEHVNEDHEDTYAKHMNAHIDAANAGKWDKAEMHAQKAEAAAAKHFKATGKKIRDIGYTGDSKYIVSEEVEQIAEGPSHLQYSGYVNDKKYTVHIPSHKDLGDYSDSALHKKLSNENPHLEHHEVTAIVNSGGAEESHEKVSHEGKEYTHHVLNRQEPRHVYEEVEQVDEKYMGFKAVMAAAKKGGARDPAAVAAAIGRKKYGKEKFQAMAAAGKKKANEEVEQIDEQSPAEIKAKYYHDQFDKVKPVKAYDKEGKLVGHYRSMAHAKQMKPGHTYKMAEEVVTEAEGSIPTTPKEKELAKHHGDPNRITFGDILKARLKSAAAKKMGK